MLVIKSSWYHSINQSSTKLPPSLLLVVFSSSPFTFLHFLGCQTPLDDDKSPLILEEEGHWVLFLGLAVCFYVLYVGILGYLCPCFSLRLKSFKHALFNVYLARFLGSMVTFTRSIETQLVVSY